MPQRLQAAPAIKAKRPGPERVLMVNLYDILDEDPEVMRLLQGLQCAENERRQQRQQAGGGRRAAV